MTTDTYWPGTKVLRDAMPAGARAALRAARIDGARALIVGQLSQALGLTAAAALRDRESYFLALRHFSPALAQLSLEHAAAAREHADRLRQRIAELDAEPDAADTPEAPPPAAIEPGPGSLIVVVSRELAAANATIDGYRAIAAFVLSFDPDSQAVLEAIVAIDERHASALAGLLARASAPYDC